MEMDNKDDNIELNKDYSDIEKNLENPKKPKRLLWLIIIFAVILIGIIVIIIVIMTKKGDKEDNNKINNYVNIIKVKYNTNSSNQIKLINYDNRWKRNKFCQYYSIYRF